MATNRNLDRALGDVVSEIRTGLADIIKKAVHNKIESIRKTKGLNKLIDRKNVVQKEISDLRESYCNQKRELENAERQLDMEIEKLDVISNEEADEKSDVILGLIGCHYRPTVSQLEAAKIISETTEAKNYLNFLQVEKNTMMMYDLAITAKEKRGIILSIQTRDWRSLGIEIPQLPFMEKFEIEEGEIKLPTVPQLTA